MIVDAQQFNQPDSAYYPRLETFEFPADTYITFVHGSWFSKPERLDPKSVR